MDLIGRKVEVLILSDALKSRRAELVAVYGRRRVGKTFLIRSVYKNNICFEFSGIHGGSLKQQLENFHLTLSAKTKRFEKPASWLEAFHYLGQYLNRLSSTKKKVVFIDEFPWLDTRKSNFLPAFDNFWNSYASKRKDIVVVICGSAASYMIKNIIKSKGGLHNRITDKIQLLPFNLRDTERMLKHNNVKLSRYDVLQLYMALGGIPHYLEKVLPGESVAQVLDRLCFSKDGFLRTEFDTIFASLFDQHDNHERLIKVLASVRKGLTRGQILKKSRLPSGGTLTKTLAELEESGFIEKYYPYQGTKDALFRITDEYSLFYLKFVAGTRPSKHGTWLKMHGLPPYKAWRGFSFETICIKHVEQIKEALKISGINSFHGSWIEKNEDGVAQIDLLIDRADNVINLCEIKFSKELFDIDKRLAGEIVKKANTFVNATNTRKTIFVTFITTYGLSQNLYSRQVVQNEVVMNDLFIEL